jgi:hypothetical protein
MDFTEGRLRKYERMMRKKPGFDRRPAKTKKGRDCPYCLYYDEHRRKCGKDKCIVFED